MNYFEFYDLHVKFHLNEVDLKSKYFNLLKKNHPDFFINDEIKYQEALLNSSINNEAFKCLSNFNSRANYILTLKYLDFEDTLPPDFLMEMMDINEALEDIQENPNLEKLLQLKSEVYRIDETINNNLIDLTLKADSKNTEDELLLKAIKHSLLKHKYILRLKETLANIAAL